VKTLLTAREIAEYLRVNVSTIYRLTRCERMPYVALGRRKLFDSSAVERWLDEKMARNGADCQSQGRDPSL